MKRVCDGISIGFNSPLYRKENTNRKDSEHYPFTILLAIANPKI